MQVCLADGDMCDRKVYNDAGKGEGDKALDV